MVYGRINEISRWLLMFWMASFLGMTAAAWSPPCDFDGDGDSDLAVFAPGARQWHVRSVGPDLTHIVDGMMWGGSGLTAVPGDYDADGVSDLAVYDTRTGEWYVYSPMIGTLILFGFNWGIPGAIPVPGDYDGDGASDLAVYDTGTGRWYIYSPSIDTMILAGLKWGYSNARPVPGDFDGDGVFDLAVHDPVTGAWNIQSLAGGMTLVLDWIWGGPEWQPVPGDFDGDGAWDLAVYRELTGDWFIISTAAIAGGSGAMAYGLQWGAPGLAPVSGDFNGDGTSDFAVFDENAGKWYIAAAEPSGADVRIGPIVAAGLSWGGPGNVTVRGDYNGDGFGDLAVYHEAAGRWYVRRLGWDGVTLVNGLGWGFPGSIPVPGDYNGDGIGDHAAYSKETGQWSILSGAGDGVILWDMQWGGDMFMPVSGDYDGDGTNDLALYTPSDGTWYIVRVSDLGIGGPTIVFGFPWGGGRDQVPVPGDYDGDGFWDLGLYDMLTGHWHVYSLTKGTTIYRSDAPDGIAWGGGGMVPVSGDFDGDGAFDFAVYNEHGGSWYIYSPSKDALVYIGAWGFRGAWPVSGDFDGDGVYDLSVYETMTGQWYIRALSGPSIASGQRWGSGGLVPVAADPATLFRHANLAP